MYNTLKKRTENPCGTQLHYRTPSIEIMTIAAENGFAASEQTFDIDPYSEGINF